MELGTVGAVLSFALKQEEKILGVYEESIKTENESDLLDLLRETARNHKKMKRALRRLRRENVTEMILEPIHGLNSDDFDIKQHQGKKASTQEWLVALEKIERKQAEFLEKSAAKVSFLPEVRQRLDTMSKTARMNASNLDEARSVD
ncbi:MAG: hypothetical protein R6V83_13230 [Candidatus Thorarchaeota archaeon]